jgi:hypothetical protein
MACGLVLLPGCASRGILPAETILHRSLELRIGETESVVLSSGETVRVKLLDLQETTDSVNGSVRRADVKVEVNGQMTTLTSGTYHLPVTVAGVQIDCPVTKGYLEKSGKENPWGLGKDVRLRVWPAGSDWIAPDSFGYPAKQRWFASSTQMANEPVYVDGGDTAAKKVIYYHFGLDISGAEGLVEVVSATDGTVTSSGREALSGLPPDAPSEVRGDNVFIRDSRGWYFRYSHLMIIDPAIRPGAQVLKGQKIGLLGKEGGSGGWSHLHFDFFVRQPSGLWGIEEGYAFLWQAYQREHPSAPVAVARPHALIWAGEKAVLDGSRSWGRGLRYSWTFGDGSTATGAVVERAYPNPGSYSEMLRVEEESGRSDVDFMIVQVIDRSKPDKPPPTIHATYAPTFGIRPGDPVIFKVRTFRDKAGGETWVFGDGSPPAEVKSDGNAVRHAADGYAQVLHRYERPGRYIATVTHLSADGVPAVGKLHVHVGEE